jgi:hypothetical protein
MTGLWAGVATAALAMSSVGLWTLRVALTARGRKLLGAAVASAEAVVFAVAFTSLAANLDSPVLLGSYATGVAGGTLLGLVADERLSAGAPVDAPAEGRPPHVADVPCPETPVTASPGRGSDGAVTVIWVAVSDRPQTTSMAHLGPNAPASSASAVTNGRPAASASATYRAS